MQNHDTRVRGSCCTQTTSCTSWWKDGSRSDGQKTVWTTFNDPVVYREQLQSGGLVRGDRRSPKPWSYSLTEDHHPTGFIDIYVWELYRKTWQSISGAIGGFCPLPSWSDSSTYTKVGVNNTALARFYESAGFGKASLQTDLAESRDTFQMAKQAALSLARPVRAVSSLSKAFFSRWGLAKVPANAYLSYIFGIKPLVEDIHETCRIIDSTLPKSFPVKGKAKKVINFNVNDRWRERYTVTIAVQYGAMVTVADEARYTMSRMGILGPSSLAWELLPFSFVADYICNLGQFLYLNEIAYRTGLSLQSGYRSELIVSDRSCVLDTSTRSMDGSYRKEVGTAYGHRVNFTRTVLDRFPTPLAPSFNLSLGSSRLLNLGALLSQRLPRR